MWFAERSVLTFRAVIGLQFDREDSVYTIKTNILLEDHIDIWGISQ